jgi:hypothetical protein
MRDQYKVLAEKYNQVAEAAPALTMDTIISVLAKEVEDWTYTGDAPYDIRYQEFTDFVIRGLPLKNNIKAAWDAMTPEDKKRTYEMVINELVIKYAYAENIESVALKALNYDNKQLKEFTRWLFSQWNSLDPERDTLQDWFYGRVGDYECTNPDEDTKRLAYNLLLKEIERWRNYLKAGKEIKKASDTAQVNLDI